MSLQATADINTIIAQLRNGNNSVNPEVFYDKQLLDTIRLDADHYIYYRYADESPIQNKADKLTVRRWAPLQAHIVPLTEGVPPKSDKGSVETYTMEAYAYGRYMEFTDQVDWKAVDPIIAHYTKEYSIVAMETLDLLAREALMANAQKNFAGGKANIEAMNIADCKPTMADLRLIILAMKKLLVKPRSNGKFHVLCSPEFTFDMISDPLVQQYMTLNQTTSPFYENSTLVPMFEMEFYETYASPTTGEYINGAGKKAIIAYKPYVAGDDDAQPWIGTRDAQDYVYRIFTEDDAEYAQVSGHVLDSRTGLAASYIPDQNVWTLPTEVGSGLTWQELKIQHTLVLGKDALTRTGLTGEGNAKMYVKPLGSAGVIDPIDQRQSIGFKINSVGFATTRLEAITDYFNIPTQLNV